MMNKLLLILSIVCFSCSFFRQENRVLIENVQDNRILRGYIRSGKIDGHIGANFYKKTKSDSLVFLHVTKPNEQNYPIDSIYFLYFDDTNYKILAQSEFEKGLIYVEVDREGNCQKYYEFGGYFIGIDFLMIQDSRNKLQLTFDINTWGSTMPDTIKQYIKIETNKNLIDFKIWNKFNRADNWQTILFN